MIRSTAASVCVLMVSSVALGQDTPLPEVVSTFSGCPLTYDPLVARFVELELGIPVSSVSEQPDYQVAVTCEGSSVTLLISAGERRWGPQNFNLEGQRDADRPRIIGLKLALLLEQATEEWTPPTLEPEPAPPMPELPPLLPELRPEPEPEPNPALEARLDPAPLWRVYGQVGATVVGHSQVWGPRAVVGATWSSEEVPWRIAVDLDLRAGALDSTLGEARTVQILPGAFAQYVVLTELFTIAGGPGYRLGWSQITGEAGEANTDASIDGVWHSPAVRLSGMARLGEVLVGLDLEGGYTFGQFEGFIEGAESVQLDGPWFALGVAAEFAL
ncbi:MAG: hypothetical protein AAF654_13820 [Myxococcota bacterium]